METPEAFDWVQIYAGQASIDYKSDTITTAPCCPNYTLCMYLPFSADCLGKHIFLLC